MGTIFGPALGGLLWIPGSPGTPCFWSSVVSAVISAIALIAVGAYMPNTRGITATAPPGKPPASKARIRATGSEGAEGVEMLGGGGGGGGSPHTHTALRGLSPAHDENGSPFSARGARAPSEGSTAATGAMDGVISPQAAEATIGGVNGASCGGVNGATLGGVNRATERLRFLPAGPGSESLSGSVAPPRLMLGVPAASLLLTAIAPRGCIKRACHGRAAPRYTQHLPLLQPLLIYGLHLTPAPALVFWVSPRL